MSTVLVTGGAGFLASHIIVRLLGQGHQVRATLRDMARRDAARSLLLGGGADPSPIEFTHADLTADAGWQEAVRGCDHVLHVASPFPSRASERQDQLIGPAHDGTLRVLRAARDAGVRRVVMTSCFGAVGFGQPMRETPFTEADWSDPAAPDVDAYTRSKIVAERTAWEFKETEAGDMEVCVINPGEYWGLYSGPITPAQSGSSRQ
nr:NAD-dependent epimerase/dehydratase family protein [Marinicella sp. W31]MDC2876110.1 NAD-dependent epimerase/dehydratase family protein [Marinicella sp. W31]